MRSQCFPFSYRNARFHIDCVVWSHAFIACDYPQSRYIFDLVYENEVINRYLRVYVTFTIRVTYIAAHVS